MDLVLFGIQGSGKGTQARKLVAEFRFDLFEAGGELRKIAATDSDLGRTVKSYIDAGNLAPHNIVMEVVRRAVEARPKDQKILFDGIPRNSEQMESFDAIMWDAGRDFRCVQLVVDPEKCVQRILGRAKIEGRIDDQDEAAIRRRMQLFREKTVPVIEEYRRRGVLVDVDGEGDVDQVFRRIVDAF